MFIKFILLLFFSLTLLDAQNTKSQEKHLSNGAVVFIYHRFGESRYPSTNIRLSQFQEQLDYLEKHNYNVWPLSRIVKALKEKESLPPKTVALTIDDAYHSVYANAFAMLKEKGFAFSVFVNTNAIDHKSKNYVTWDQMREMQKDGGEFFSHSLTHDYLVQKKDETPQEAKKRITQEIVKAQKRIDDELGKKQITMLAYPFGEYDETTQEVLKSLGAIGVAQNSGPLGTDSNLLALSRFPMNEALASMSGFETKLNTLTFPIKSLSPCSPILSKNPPELTLTLENPISGVNCFLSNGEKIDIEWMNERTFQVKSSEPLKGPRALYTCTAPAKNSKWYWYSHLWIVAKR